MDAIVAGILVAIPTIGGLVVYLGRKLIDRSFDQGLERFRIQTQAIHDAEIESLRLQLGMASFEHQTRFSRLHERRIDILDGVYTRLVQAHRAFQSMTSPMQLGSEDPVEKKSAEASDLGNEFVTYFERNRIWLPAALCDDIEAFSRALRDVGVDFSLRDHDQKFWLDAVGKMNSDVPALRRSIETHARTLLDPPIPSPSSGA